jgi:glutamyl-tRNA synthetase
MSSTPIVVGRLAPSPTGLLHLGHARSFLLAYWSVRQRHGRLLLRLEDLDTERSTQRYVDATLRDLEWLGLDWDGPPRRQSLDLAPIREVARLLVERGCAYPCVCTRADLRAAVNAPQEGSSELRYSGRCRSGIAEPNTAEAAAGLGAALRYRVPDGPVAVNDSFVGQRVFDVAEECGDFLILRRDQVPSYQLAVVVDDAAAGVTEVVRGDDLLPSAARQQLLQRDLSYRTPQWLHVPLVVDRAGRRFAKRTDDLSLDSLRAKGVDPRAIVGWAARNSGWPEVERATAAELVATFDWGRVPHARVVFDTSNLSDLLR